MIKNGDHVIVEYEGTLESGEVFDSSKHGDHSHPLEFTVGSGEVIPGFDAAVLGMNKGETKTFSLEAKDAYGMPDPTLQQDIPKSSLPKTMTPHVGMQLMLRSPDGHPFPAMVAAVNESTITLDLNHPLAGKKLTFTITIAGINEENPHRHHHDHKGGHNHER